jgi:hypothetical protein
MYSEPVSLVAISAPISAGEKSSSGSPAAGAGVVDHDRDLAELLLHGGEEALGGLRVGDVKRVREAFPPGLLDEGRGLGKPVDAPAADRDAPTKRSELRRDRPTDAGSCTGDESHAVALWVELTHRTLQVGSQACSAFSWS